MQDFISYKRSTIQYWERRRLVYNVAQIVPAWFGFMFTDTINWVGDSHSHNYPLILIALAFCAVCANVCYSFCYAMEFIYGSDDPESRWQKSERTFAVVSGTAFSMILSAIGGANIAHWVWYSRIH